MECPFKCGVSLPPDTLHYLSLSLCSLYSPLLPSLLTLSWFYHFLRLSLSHFRLAFIFYCWSFTLGARPRKAKCQLLPSSSTLVQGVDEDVNLLDQERWERNTQGWLQAVFKGLEGTGHRLDLTWRSSEDNMCSYCSSLQGYAANFVVVVFTMHSGKFMFPVLLPWSHDSHGLISKLFHLSNRAKSQWTHFRNRIKKSLNHCNISLILLLSHEPDVFFFPRISASFSFCVELHLSCWVSECIQTTEIISSWDWVQLAIGVHTSRAGWVDSWGLVGGLRLIGTCTYTLSCQYLICLQSCMTCTTYLIHAVQSNGAWQVVHCQCVCMHDSCTTWQNSTSNVWHIVHFDLLVLAGWKLVAGEDVCVCLSAHEHFYVTVYEFNKLNEQQWDRYTWLVAMSNL